MNHYTEEQEEFIEESTEAYIDDTTNEHYEFLRTYGHTEKWAEVAEKIKELLRPLLSKKLYKILNETPDIEILEAAEPFMSITVDYYTERRNTILSKSCGILSHYNEEDKKYYYDDCDHILFNLNLDAEKMAGGII